MKAKGLKVLPNREGDRTL